MSNHSNLGIGNQHILENWSYADETARTAAIGFSAADLGKVAYQESDGSYWRLTAVTPTWAQIGGGGNLQAEITIGTEASNEIAITVQLQDSSGNDITSGNYALYMFLSESDTNVNIAGNLPDGLVAGAGNFAEIITNAYWLAIFENGEFGISISETDVETWYLIIVFPDGTFSVSDEITFA